MIVVVERGAVSHEVCTIRGTGPIRMIASAEPLQPFRFMIVGWERRTAERRLLSNPQLDDAASDQSWGTRSCGSPGLNVNSERTTATLTGRRAELVIKSGNARFGVPSW